MAVTGIRESTRKLTAIELAGFKSAIDPVRVNFRDITILAGANSTGKSTIMQPLLLIKQTIEKPFDPGALAIDGPLARFTNADQFFSRSVSKASTQEFSVTFEHGSAKVTFTYGRSAALGIDLVRISFDRGKKKYTWKNGQALNKDDELILDAIALEGFTKGYVRHLPWKFHVARDRAVLVAGDEIPKSSPLTRDPYFIPIISPANAVVDEVRNLIYLPGLTRQSGAALRH